MYTIGKLAKSAEINLETIRYYERQGLIEQPKKPAKGYRQYSEDVLITLLFIKRSQQLGFTLSEISTLLELSNGSCRDVQLLAEKKLDTVSQKLKNLRRLEKSLKLLINQCRENSDETHCPIIESLVPIRKP